MDVCVKNVVQQKLGKAKPIIGVKNHMIYAGSVGSDTTMMDVLESSANQSDRVTAYAGNLGLSKQMERYNMI